MARNPVDIIIPVYNGLEDLRSCMESVLRHTDLNTDRVILVDDKSPDENVRPYLRSLKREGIVVLENEKNLGFSGAVNRGIGYSQRDILLLNTDTLVTAGWVDKLTGCAYSDAAIGTVTPFSNNASLCSIPQINTCNVIPDGLTVDEYAQVVEECSLKEYPRIPVGVGFCMYIKRETIDAVGLFDQETFDGGYGEENDFCFRAQQAGYCHALCDDTFIYHRGMGSFLDRDKKQLSKSHEAVLRERYPLQTKACSDYLLNDPHGYLRTNVDLYSPLKKTRKSIFYLLHMDFHSGSYQNIGGTQFHVQDLVRELRNDYNIFVAGRDGELLRVTVFLGSSELPLKFYIGPKPDFPTYHDERLYKLLKSLVAAFAPDVIHVQHFAFLSLDIFHIAHEFGIPLMATLHDYYYLCPTVSLIDNNCQYCGNKECDCHICLNKQFGYATKLNFIEVWRKRCSEALSLCQKIIVPTQGVKDTYQKYYPNLADRMQVIAHGMDLVEVMPDLSGIPEDKMVEAYVDSAIQEDYSLLGWTYFPGCDCEEDPAYIIIRDEQGTQDTYRITRYTRPDVVAARQDEKYTWSGFLISIPDCRFHSGTLNVRLAIQHDGEFHLSQEISVPNYVRRPKTRPRIAFLGGLSQVKGSRMACKLIKMAGNRFEWYVFGGIGDTKLHALESKNLHKSSWYQRQNIKSMLLGNQIDLICILSICPESFCYTLSESLMAGVPVLATDVGALGERLRDSGYGWLVDVDADAETVMKKIRSIFDNEDEYQAVLANVASFKHKSAAEMGRDYSEIYQKIMAGKKNISTVGVDRRMLLNGYLLGQGLPGASKDASEQERYAQNLELQLQKIQASTAYRFFNFFSEKDFPFKRTLQRIVRFCYCIYGKCKR